MNEPTLIRCTRCSALVALQDATLCGFHQTDPLCTFCWKHHVESHATALAQAGAPVTVRCWAEVGTLDWT